MILVTGATGYVGRNLIKLLDNRKVKCFVRKNSEIKALEGFNIEYGDITDIASIERVLDNVDAVIHMAAVVNSSDKEIYYLVNVKGTKNLIEACKNRGVKRIIFVSSMAATREFLDDYGKSKKEAEELVANSGLKYTILRPTIIYGADNSTLKQFIEYIQKVPFLVPVIGSGEAKIRPVYIDDVVNIITRSVDNPQSIYKTYNLLGGTKISINYFIDFISSRLGIKKVKVHIPMGLALTSISFLTMFNRKFSITKDFIKNLDYGVVGDNKDAEVDFSLRFKKLSHTLKL